MMEPAGTSKAGKRAELPCLETLQQTANVLEALLVGARREELTWKPAPDRWSITEVLAHLLDMEVNALRLRARRMVEEENPLLPSIDQVAAAKEKEYAEQDPRKILEQFRREREQSLAWLRTLDAEVLSRTARHQEIGELTFENHIHQWAFHDLGHIRQIAELLRARAHYPHTGNYHKYYSVEA